jgi:hypothetical protein
VQFAIANVSVRDIKDKVPLKSLKKDVLKSASSVPHLLTHGRDNLGTRSVHKTKLSKNVEMKTRALHSSDFRLLDSSGSDVRALLSAGGRPSSITMEFMDTDGVKKSCDMDKSPGVFPKGSKLEIYTKDGIVMKPVDTELIGSYIGTHGARRCSLSINQNELQGLAADSDHI